MRIRRIWAVGMIVSLLFSPIAMASTVPTIFYNSAYVGNSWTYSGNYDDSLPEEGYPSEQIVADTHDYTTSFSSYEISGYLPPDAEVDVTYQDSSGSFIGSKTLYAADLNKQIMTPPGTWGMIFWAYESSNTAGDYWLTETWSNAYNVSTSGEVIWTQPSWGFTTAPSGSGSSSSFTPPPNWTQIEQEIGHDIWFEAPPIPAPPSGSDQITASPALTTPTITAPQEPTISVGQSFNFTSGYSAISVPTTGSSAFTIGDPNNLPHQPAGTILIPGQVGSVGYTPAAPSIANSNPLPSDTPPAGNSGPAPNASQPSSMSGPTPGVSQPLYGTGAIPGTSSPQMYTPPMPSSNPPVSTVNLSPSYTGQTIAPNNQPQYTIPGSGP